MSDDDPSPKPRTRARLRIGPSVHVDVDEPREIKVKLPVQLHVKLHTLKIVSRRSISDIVLEALEAYLQRVDRDEKKS